MAEIPVKRFVPRFYMDLKVQPIWFASMWQEAKLPIEYNLDMSDLTPEQKSTIKMLINMRNLVKIGVFKVVYREHEGVTTPMFADTRLGACRIPLKKRRK